MKPLGDVRILDLTRVVSGPFCTMMLADMGADVIKVEEPTTGDDTRAFGPPFMQGEAAYYLSINRGKRSLTLDLKHPAAPEIVRKLVENSDVFVENFRPGAADRLGFDFTTVSNWNPRIVYCSISGFGTSGPERDRPGYDLVVQGESGIMEITGDPSGPPTKIGTSVADLVTGLYAAQAILLALRVRDQTGKAQHVEVAMIDALSSLLTFNAGIFFASGKSPSRRGNAHPTIVPYETFQAADGWINLAVANDTLWRKFCAACGWTEFVDDPRFATAPQRVRNRDTLVPVVAALIAQQPRAYWVEVLNEAGVPCGQIKTVAEVCTDPAMIARGAIRDLPHPTIGTVRTIDTPIRFSAETAGPKRAAPLLGEHTREILETLAQLTPSSIDALAAAGAIRRPDPPCG